MRIGTPSSSSSARAELIAWAVDVHAHVPDEPLPVVLANELDRGPRRPDAPQWPLPEPPNPAEDDEARSLSTRIADLLGHDLDLAPETARVVEVPVPHRTVRFGQDLES